MKINTKFSCGDKVWCILYHGFDGKAVELTVGYICVRVTDSSGVNGGAVEPEAPEIQFDNYKPQKKYEEEYMMIETGIGSGQVYRLGHGCFSTKEEALKHIELTKRNLDS